VSRIDKSIVESIVIDWFRNVTSKEKSRWVGVRVLNQESDDLRRKRRRKKLQLQQIGGLNKSF
jgi:hypothetical protein